MFFSYFKSCLKYYYVYVDNKFILHLDTPEGNKIVLWRNCHLNSFMNFYRCLSFVALVFYRYNDITGLGN